MTSHLANQQELIARIRREDPLTIEAIANKRKSGSPAVRRLALFLKLTPPHRQL